MGDGCLSCIGYVLIGFIISPVILQGIGTFGSDWIVDSSCSSLDHKPTCCINQTSYVSESCSGNFRLRDLHSELYKVQLAAFIILLSPIACVLLDVCCVDENSDSYGACSAIGGFCFIFYPVAGVLSFVGCMITLGLYSGETFGTAFKCCLAAGLLVLIVTVLLICVICCKGKRGEQSSGHTGTVIQRGDSDTLAAAPYGGVNHTVAAVIEERGVVHDPETGGFIAFVRKVNVYHQLTHWQ